MGAEDKGAGDERTILARFFRIFEKLFLRDRTQDDEIAILARFFRRNGYIRIANKERIIHDGWNKYKKGCEIRLVAKNERELGQIRNSLISAGFKPGRAFVKWNQIVQPIYGREQAERFAKLILKEYEKVEMTYVNERKYARLRQV